MSNWIGIMIFTQYYSKTRKYLIKSISADRSRSFGFVQASEDVIDVLVRISYTPYILRWVPSHIFTISAVSQGHFRWKSFIFHQFSPAKSPKIVPKSRDIMTLYHVYLFVWSRQLVSRSPTNQMKLFRNRPSYSIYSYCKVQLLIHR